MDPHGQYRSHLVSINNYFIVKRIYYVTIATVQSLLSTSRAETNTTNIRIFVRFESIRM